MKHFTVYCAIVLLPFLYSINHYNISLTDCLGILGGLFVWAVAEYGFHRYAFHNHNLSERTHNLLAYDHVNHHLHPEDREDLFLPLRLTLPVALMLFVIVCILLTVPIATFFLMGLFIGLAWYEFVHFQAHSRTPTSWPLNYLVRRHLHHHYEDESRTFGVSSPIIDWLMQTK